MTFQVSREANAEFGTARARADLGPLFVCAVFNILGWHILTAYGVSQMAARVLASSLGDVTAISLPCRCVWMARSSRLTTPITCR